jgi:hypothetical protein
VRGSEQGVTTTATSAVCVLGMSRSGTSLTARIVNISGVDLGAREDLLGASPANPDGMWEHLGFVLLNERILKLLGGSWKEPPTLVPGWERSELLVGLRQEARALVESFGGSSRWGWKDPRNCLTLPFWQELLPQMRYVVVLRNPLDVAASLQQRNRMPIERGLALWLDYMSAALRHTEGGPRIVVSYEEYFDDWRAPVGRIARFLGDGEAGLGDDLERRIEGAINVGHRHHHTSLRDLAGDPRVPPDVLSLYHEALGCGSAR